MADKIEILGNVTDEKGNRIPFVSITIAAYGTFVNTLTNDQGSYSFQLDGTTDIQNLNLTFDAQDYFRETKNNLSKSGERIDKNNFTIDLYQVNITLQPSNIDLATQQAELQIQTQELENLQIEASTFSSLPGEIKFSIVLNRLKESLKRTLFPFILSLLIPFGVKFVQEILDKATNPKPDTCPDPNKLKELIRKRNQLVKQLNQIYNIIKSLTTVLTITGVAIQALQIGLNIAKAFANPTTASAETTFKQIELRLEIAGIAVNSLTITSAVIGVVLQTILNLLNRLDNAIQQCSEEQNIPFEELNDELNSLANQTTTELQQSADNYKGFTFEIKLDEVNTSSYPKRYAQALNVQGVPVLRSDSSFTSNPQVLIDQLKFIIDTQNLKGN